MKWSGKIIEHVKKTYNLMIGERTARELKIKIGSRVSWTKRLSMEIRGRDLVSAASEDGEESLPKKCAKRSPNPFKYIIEAVRVTLERTLPTFADLIGRGILWPAAAR